MLNKPPSKTLNYTQGAEDARRALALQTGEPRLHSRRQAQPALAEHSSLHKSLPPFSSRAGYLSLTPPPVGFELPWAASPHKGKGSPERFVARAIDSGCCCCCVGSFCLTVGLCSRPARHIALQPQDVLFLLLCTLKHAGNWDFNGKMFDIKGPTFERMILGFADRICDTLYSLAVEKYEKNYTMGRLVKDGTTFGHYKFSLYATDVTFQHTNRPAGNHEEAKVYFSKTQASTDISRRSLFYPTV